MNADMFRRVADAIQINPEGYDQQDFGTGDPICGSSCCVAGWAAYLAEGGPVRGYIHATAVTALDIDSEESLVLFGATWPSWWAEKAGLIDDDVPAVEFTPTPAQAVGILRAMADDEEVWLDMDK